MFYSIMLIKPKIITSFIDSRKLCSFTIKNPSLGCLKLDSRMVDNRGFKRMFIELKNQENKILGHEELSLSQNSNEMLGLNILVDPKYQNDNKGRYRFGEILRLASIIEMLENKKKSFKIYSKSTAIYFHSKYKFEPNITSFQERDKALETIAEDISTEVKDLAYSAKKLLNQANKNTNSGYQRNLCIITNQIAKEYIKRIMSLGKQEYKQHLFKRGIDMILTQNDVLKNRTFFNYLIQKHGIDYTI